MRDIPEGRSVGDMETSEAPTVHVLPGPHGGWLVRAENESNGALEHATVNHAERHARQCAEALGVAPSRLTLVAGATARDKRFRLD